jgi:hypothetical protein
MAAGRLWLKELSLAIRRDLRPTVMGNLRPRETNRALHADQLPAAANRRAISQAARPAAGRRRDHSLDPAQEAQAPPLARGLVKVLDQDKAPDQDKVQVRGKVQALAKVLARVRVLVKAPDKELRAAAAPTRRLELAEIVPLLESLPCAAARAAQARAQVGTDREPGTPMALARHRRQMSTDRRSPSPPQGRPTPPIQLALKSSAKCRPKKIANYSRLGKHRGTANTTRWK